MKNMLAGWQAGVDVDVDWRGHGRGHAWTTDCGKGAAT